MAAASNASGKALAGKPGAGPAHAEAADMKLNSNAIQRLFMIDSGYGNFPILAKGCDTFQLPRRQPGLMPDQTILSRNAPGGSIKWCCRAIWDGRGRA
jgi:hypothetical protein